LVTGGTRHGVDGVGLLDSATAVGIPAETTNGTVA
jgi:hypothetical protein